MRRAVPVFAGDVSFRMTDFAARNAERAGVAPGHRVQGRRRAAAAAAGGRSGTLMLNPPYGERIAPKGRGGSGAAGARAGSKAAARRAEFFAALAAHWKRHYAGWTGWVLSPDMKLPTHMRLKESRAACRCGTGRSSAGCSASTSWPARRASEPRAISAQPAA